MSKSSAIISLALALILAFPAFPAISQAQPGGVSEEWMGVYLNGKKAGYASTITREVSGGYEVKEDLDAVLSVLGFGQEIKMTTTSRLSGTLSVKDISFAMDAGIARTSISGRMSGKALALRITDSAGDAQDKRIDFDEPPYVSASVSLFLSRQDLKPGSRFTLPYFDPSTLSREPLYLEVDGIEQMKVGDKAVPVYRVSEEYAGMTTRSWFTKEGGTIKGDGPMGFTFVRESKEQAMKPPDGGYQPEDIIAMASIPADVNITEPDKVVFLKARLSGADFGGLDIGGGRQLFSGNVVEVTREDLGKEKPVSLPVKDPALAVYLKPEPYVQSDEPAIRAKASELTAGESDVISAARKIADWVNASLEKKPSAGIPDAAEVLKGLSGDCNEHTVLFTALARAAGIPAKMDAGVVMVGGRFYYHAWPEVWAGRWVAVDPTFGQFPADATHIRLEEGGLDRQVRITKLMGRMKVAILGYKAQQ